MTILIKRKPYTQLLSKYFEIYSHMHIHLFNTWLSSNTGVTYFQKARKWVWKTRTRGHITPARSLITPVFTTCMYVPRYTLIVWLLRQYVYSVALPPRIFCLFKQHPLWRRRRETSLPTQYSTFHPHSDRHAEGTHEILHHLRCLHGTTTRMHPYRSVASKRCNAENNDTSLIVSGVH